MKKFVISITLCFLALIINGQKYSKVNDVDISFEPVEDRGSIVKQRLEIVNDHIYRYLKADRYLTKQEHLDLRSKGIILLDYVGKKSYLAALHHDIDQSVLKGVGFSNISTLKRSTKASIEVDKDFLPEYAVHGRKADLVVNYMSNLSSDYVINELEGEGVGILKSNGVDPFLIVRCELDYIESLIELPYISYVEVVPPPSRKEDRRGRNLHRVNRTNGINGRARNYTGNDVNVLVRDDGRVFDHIDFKGRVDQIFSGPSRGSHGDGVAGIMCGSGNLDPYYKGMATGAFMYVTDYDASFLDITLDLHTDFNVLVTNSSYSNGCNDGYTSSARTVDGQMRENPKLLHVFSAGNDGFEDCGYGAGAKWGNITGGHKIGKNVMTTANLNYLGQLEGSSSRGPAADGRIKPDISANGFGHESTAQNQGYMTFGGTSAAAPVIAGVAALLHEAYRKLFGGIADAALLKTIMLNTATDLGNTGPDFMFGWGSVNAHKAALVLEENRFVQGSINQGESISHSITVPPGTKQLKVMTYWVDRENVSSASNNLVNDINTTLSGTENIYLPWILDHTPDASKLNLPATKGEDHKNNMEQIVVDNPTNDSYELTINGDVLPFGHADYCVTWEFMTDDIEVIYPNGGENIEIGETTVIHWDAFGDTEPFLIEVFDDNDSLIIERNVMASRRWVQVVVPDHFAQYARLKISRGDKEAISEGTFVISNYTDNLEIDNTTDTSKLVWPEVPHAIEYYIYRLGQKFMEISDTVQTNTFVIPDDEFYKDSWLGVSAVFNDGVEGKRSRAIPGKFIGATIAPNDLPACKEEVYTFATENPDPNTTYLWEFGAGASPASANSVGPHEVSYATAGAKVVLLTIYNIGGTNGTFQVVNVGEPPIGGVIVGTELGDGAYRFESNVQNADSIVWDMGDGTVLSGDTVEHTYESSGTYEVIAKASNDCGEVESYITVTVIVLDTENEGEEEFKVFPNPNNGQFELYVPKVVGERLYLNLFSMDGKLVMSKSLEPISDNKITIDIRGITDGMYQLELTDEIKSTVLKIVIQ